MFKILDCTLRDGGYYNNWDFDINLINSYLRSMAYLNIDLVEIGFRTNNKEKYLGPLAYSRPDFIQSLKVPKKLKSRIGVMINASELVKLGSLTKTKNYLHTLFPNKDLISFVRIACHESEILDAFEVCKWFEKKNIKVFINLMQISEISAPKLKEILTKSKNYKFEAFYVADSLGSLYTGEIAEIVKLIRKSSNVKIGIHTHNNKLMALANSLEAVKYGAVYVDSTIKGMGRGCGNTQTEYLFVEKEKKNLTKTLGNGIEYLAELIENSFEELNNTHKWNDNLYYYLSGEYKIHPSYIQEILKNKNYSPKDTLSIIKALIGKNSRKFNIDNIKLLKNDVKNNLDLKKIFKNKNILIIGGGKNFEKIKNFLKKIINKKKFIVLSINKDYLEDDSLKQYVCVSHPAKIMSNKIKEALEKKNKIITPTLSDINFNDPPNKKNILFYGVEISEKKIKFYKNYCRIPSPLGLFYAIAIANSGNCKSIYLTGIDGYKFGDEKNSIIEKFLKVYCQNSKLANLKSITPTRYNIETVSPFSIDF
jgi:4-hydroxy 2-oxovalerate aldolase